MNNQECKVRPEMSRTNETRHIKRHETCKCKIWIRCKCL